MALSYVQYEGNGTQQTFAIPFPYLDKSHIEVRVNLDVHPYTWDDPNTIRITPAPAPGAVIEARRITPRETRMVDFVDGSVLTEGDLDLNALQTFYIVQEAIDIAGGTLELLSDGSYGAGGRRIKEVGNPVELRDAVTKEYHDGTWIPQMQALLSATSGERATAQAARTGAEAARDLAAQYRDTALAHRNAAATSETNAANSASASQASRVASEQARDLARDWAEKADNTDVNGSGTRSARHHANRAAASASAAANSEQIALSHKTAAETARAGAEGARDTALVHRNDAQTFRNEAEYFRNQAQTFNPANYSPVGHTHDDRYYTENEVNNLLSGKANVSGQRFNGEIEAHNCFGYNRSDGSGRVGFGWDWNNNWWFNRDNDSTAHLNQNANGSVIHRFTFHPDGNIWCNGRGWVWDHIHSKAPADHNHDGRYILSDSTSYLGFDNNNYERVYIRHGNGTYVRIITSPAGTVNRGNRAGGYIEWNTDIGAVGTTYFTSDERFKENIKPSKVNATARLQKMAFIEYSWKKDKEGKGVRGIDGDEELGVSAQNLRSIDPKLTYELEDGSLGVNEPRLISLLGKALQESIARIDALEKEVAALKAKAK